MDIIKELELGTIENNFQDSINYIEEQKKIWDKKSHIFKVIRLAHAIEELENRGFFRKHNIEFINLLHNCNHTNGNFVRFIFGNSNGEFPIRLNGRYDEPHSKLVKYFDALDGFEQNYIQEEDFEVSIILKDDIKKQLFNILLSQELRTVVGYSECQLELKSGNDSEKQKKFKV